MLLILLIIAAVIGYSTGSGPRSATSASGSSMIWLGVALSVFGLVAGAGLLLVIGVGFLANGLAKSR